MSLLSRLLLALCLTFAAAPAFAQKAYVRNDLAADGLRLEERLKREVTAGNRSVVDLVRAGDIVLIRVFYIWNVMSPLPVGLTNNTSSTRLIQSSIAFRNEPYTS